MVIDSDGERLVMRRYVDGNRSRTEFDNDGETIAISHPTAGEIISLTYDDRAPWPVTPDGSGFSLVRDPANGFYHASTTIYGSPGLDSVAYGPGGVVINEILSNSVWPEVDTIELLNIASTNVDISGWFLTDDPTLPQKFRIPNRPSLASGEFAVFDENDFNPTPGLGTSFSLSSFGDDVYLFSADAGAQLTGYSHGFEFVAAAENYSFGRYINSAGEELFPMAEFRTFGELVVLGPKYGATNSRPFVGQMVINEIKYNPEPGGDEFVELKCVGDAGGIDLLGYRVNGLGFTFTNSVTLISNEIVLLVATNPADFRTKYGLPPGLKIFGPYSGSLQNSGEKLELQRSDPPTTNGIPWITIDEVRYNDRAPWSSAADGSGMSLQRAPSAGYGNEPANWLAAAPTPGQTVGTGDSDGDGLPDDWEQANGTFVFIPDANDDPDGDGFTNWEEYLAGTHPNDAASAFRLSQIAAQNGNIILQFLASSNRTYTLLFKSSLAAVQWSKLTDISAHPTNRVVNLTNTVPGDTQRFYRLVTPAQAEGFSGILRMEGISVNAGMVALGFNAASNRSYSVQYKSSIGDSAWLRLKDVPARPTNHAANVPANPNGTARGFYRVVTPAQL